MSAEGRGRSPDDEEFERIVAGLELSMPPEHDRPADRAPERDVPPREDEDDLEAPRGVFDPRFSDRLDPADREDEEPEDPDDRFVPPDPEPGPPLDAITRAAWAGMVGAPAILVVATVIGYAVPRAVAGALVLVAVVSLVVLIVRRGNEDHGGGPDHGAVL